MKLTPTKVLHYGLLLIAAYIVYSWLTKEGGGRDSYEHHPRNKAKFKDADEEVKGKGHRYADDVRHVREEEEEPIGRKQKYENHKIPDRETVKKPSEEDESKYIKDKYKIQEDIKEEKLQDNLIRDEVAVDLNNDIRKDEQPKIESGLKDTLDEELEEYKKFKVKQKEEPGEDLLKDFNDADLKGDPEVHKQIDKLDDHKVGNIPKLKKEWHETHDDLDTAADKVRRRKEFFEKIMAFGKKEKPADMSEDRHIEELSNDFTYVTAADSNTFKGALAFINSVQMNYRKSDIGIIDVGLSKEEIDYLNTLCKVEVVDNFLPLYPEFITKNMAQKLWRPIILQVALSKYGHFVYVDPMRHFKRGVELDGYYALSRMGGAAMFGNVKGYSTAVVTNPEMYYYLAINVRKLLKLQHVEITMMIMHASPHLRHYFTRWLFRCTLEEYCIAPPGSKRKCDQNLYPKSKKYADCHRYDESAINILLASWHNYDYDHYSHADYVTRHYDGRDVTQYLKVCTDKKKEGL